jgi:hypothetical protein
MAHIESILKTREGKIELQSHTFWQETDEGYIEDAITITEFTNGIEIRQKDRGITVCTNEIRDLAKLLNSIAKRIY